MNHKPILSYSFTMPILLTKAMKDLEQEIDQLEAEIIEMSMLLDDNITDVTDAKRELSRIFNV